MSRNVYVCVSILCCISVLVISENKICDICVCTFNSNHDQDYGEIIDCSYKPGVLNLKYNLTSHATTLDLSWNNITKLEPRNLLKSKTVIELVLSNNDLVELTENSINFPELKRLDLSFNDLEVIKEDVFRNISKLEYLNLANNKFTTFAKLTFHHLANLQEIILDNNKIGSTFTHTNIFDRNGFGLTHMIKNISMSGIGMNTVPDNFFADAYDIRKLIISNNNLSTTFEVPYTLEYLDVSDNPIKQIVMEDFIDLPGIKELKLNNLAISEVPEYTFSSLHRLAILELERNKNLTVFSESAFGREVLEDSDDFALEELSLRGSRLSQLDEKLLEPFGKLLKLDLQGNPWKCDCNIKWLKQLQIAEKDYEHVRCASPGQLYNKKIFKLPDQRFQCQGKRHLIALSIAAVTLGVTLAVAALWIFVYIPRQRNPTIMNMHPAYAHYSALPMH